MSTADFAITETFAVLPSVSDSGIIDFHNSSSQSIAAFSPVSVTGAYGGKSWQLARYCGKCTLAAIPAADDTLPWAVALTQTPPGGFGRAVISGVAPAYFSGTGKYAVPSAGVLVAADTGNALIVLAPEEMDGGTLPGALLLGGGGTAAAPSDEYRGIFKLRAESAVQLSVVDGRNPASANCGYTDVPGVRNIPVRRLDIEGSSLYYIYLVFFYDSGSYTAEVRTDLPSDAVFSELLGTFCGGKVTQVYKTDDDRMIFGNDWYLV